MTIKQARARFKQVFRTDAPEELTIEQIQLKIDEEKLKKAEAKSKADAEKSVKQDQIKSVLPSSKNPKYQVRFGVIIPGMGKFTRAQIEENEAVMEYLIEIGSPAVVKL